MKYILLASALMVSGVAFAQANPQDAGQGTMPPPASTTTPPATTAPAPMPPAPDTPPDATTMPPPAPTTPPGTTTMGTTGTTGSGTVMVQQGGNMTPPPTDTGPYPRCSRTITDHCQQSSARESDTKGGPPKHRRHRR